MNRREDNSDNEDDDIVVVESSDQENDEQQKVVAADDDSCIVICSDSDDDGAPTTAAAAATHDDDEEGKDEDNETSSLSSVDSTTHARPQFRRARQLYVKRKDHQGSNQDFTKREDDQQLEEDAKETNGDRETAVELRSRNAMARDTSSTRRSPREDNPLNERKHFDEKTCSGPYSAVTYTRCEDESLHSLNVCNDDYLSSNGPGAEVNANGKGDTKNARNKNRMAVTESTHNLCNGHSLSSNGTGAEVNENGKGDSDNTHNENRPAVTEDAHNVRNYRDLSSNGARAEVNENGKGDTDNAHNEIGTADIEDTHNVRNGHDLSSHGVRVHAKDKGDYENAYNVVRQATQRSSVDNSRAMTNENGTADTQNAHKLSHNIMPRISEHSILDKYLACDDWTSEEVATAFAEYFDQMLAPHQGVLKSRNVMFSPSKSLLQAMSKLFSVPLEWSKKKSIITFALSLVKHLKIGALNLFQDDWGDSSTVPTGTSDIRSGEKITGKKRISEFNCASEHVRKRAKPNDGPSPTLHKILGSCPPLIVKLRNQKELYDQYIKTITRTVIGGIKTLENEFSYLPSVKGLCESLTKEAKHDKSQFKEKHKQEHLSDIKCLCDKVWQAAEEYRKMASDEKFRRVFSSPEIDGHILHRSSLDAKNETDRRIKQLDEKMSETPLPVRKAVRQMLLSELISKAELAAEGENGGS